MLKRRKGGKSRQGQLQEWTAAQGAHYELTIVFSFFDIYNVNYKGGLTSLYLGFREKSNSLCLLLRRNSGTAEDGATVQGGKIQTFHSNIIF